MTQLITQEHSLNGSNMMDHNPTLEQQLWDEATALNDLIEDCEQRMARYRRQFQAIMMYFGIEDFDPEQRLEQREIVDIDHAIKESLELHREENRLAHKTLDIPAGLSEGIATLIYQALAKSEEPLHVSEIRAYAEKVMGRELPESTVSSRLSLETKWFKRVRKGFYTLR